MPANLTPVDAFPAALQAIIDGDPVDQVTRVAVMQAYADAATFLRNRVKGAAVRNVQVPITTNDPAGVNGASYNYSAATMFYDVVAAANDEINIPLPEILGAELVSITAYYLPTAGAFAASAQLPDMEARFRPVTTSPSSVTGIAAIADTSPNAGAYDIFHSITAVAGTPYPFSPDERAELRFTCDDSALTFRLIGVRMAIQPV